VDAVDPQVDVIGARQIALTEGLGFVLPLRREPGDRGRREPRTRAEELLQRRTEVTGGETMQVQQRQHLGHLRVLTRPRWQNHRRKPLPLTGISVDALVIDPWRRHRHRARRSQHRVAGRTRLSLLVEYEVLDRTGHLHLVAVNFDHGVQPGRRMAGRQDEEFIACLIQERWEASHGAVPQM
jgi:hypothetical protein